MSDADMENTETQVSLDFAIKCKYITQENYHSLIKKIRRGWPLIKPHG